MHFKFRGVNDAFHHLVKGIHDGTILTNTSPSRAGEVLVVEEPVTVSYQYPVERVLFNQFRDANPFFHLFESLWMLAGRNDVAPLEYYSSDIGKIASDDGKTFNGAYGHRWRHATVDYRSNVELPYLQGPDNFGVDQLKILVDQLKRKPESRRAVLQMWTVEDDLLRIDDTKDVCCNTNAYFLVEKGPCRECGGSGHTPVDSAWREGDRVHVCPKCKGYPSEQPRYLNMTVCNRSNDMIWGLLGANVVHFSFLQEYLASCIGLEPGYYHQFTNNMHVYTERWDPEEWLKPYNPRRDMHSPKIYSYTSSPDWKLVPLVKDPETFDKECKGFVEAHGKDPLDVEYISNYSEPFLQSVALPMCLAFHYHKRRMYPEALLAISSVASDDWKIAGKLWVEKRRDGWAKKQEKKTENKDGGGNSGATTDSERDPYLEREMRRLYPSAGPEQA